MIKPITKDNINEYIKDERERISKRNKLNLCDFCDGERMLFIGSGCVCGDCGIECLKKRK